MPKSVSKKGLRAQDIYSVVMDNAYGIIRLNKSGYAMKLKDLAGYIIVAAGAGSSEQYLREMKRLEWIFIAVRWLWVPIVFLMAWLHEPISKTAMWWLGAALAMCNIAACILNSRVRDTGFQKILGVVLLVVDTLVAWGIIFLFAHDFYTSAYAAFVYIVIESAVRFGLAGSLSAVVVFALGMYGAYTYRYIAHGVRFSNSGYAFWTAVIFLVAVSIGIVVNEWKKQRSRNEVFLRENTLLSERQRMARELHDTVLKTLQGLSLEARALANKAAAMPDVKETAQYIGEVCARTGREMREMIFDLRSEVPAAGIGSQIAVILDEWNLAAGIKGEFSLSGQDVKLSPETARQLRNIVSEALTNIRRHASASRVKIAVKISSGDVDIEISDNGRGLTRGLSRSLGRDADELHAFVAEGKLGIAGMKERTELLGGHFSISSGSTGTSLSFNVPLTPIFGKE